jgi:hypothetical protein
VFSSFRTTVLAMSYDRPFLRLASLTFMPCLKSSKILAVNLFRKQF